MIAPTPANTHAIVVGIERYDAGTSWNLDGPASDAVRFLEYLGRQGVPTANVRTYLRTMPENTALNGRAQALSSELGQPNQSALDDLIEQSLCRLNAGFLLFFWAGHGVITLDDTRRLFTADATPNVKRNIDLNAMLATLRSDAYPGLERQAIIVDACANYVPNPTANLAHKSYSIGVGIAGRQQFALYAASPGEYAKNLNAEKSGLLSKELLAILMKEEAMGVWPPDLVAASEKLAARFIALRQQGKTRQTPATYWFRSPTRGGHFLGEMNASFPSAILPARRLLSVEYKALLEAFLAVDTMRSRDSRDWVVRQLRPEVGAAIDRRSSDRQDTMAILDKSLYYHALGELLECINLNEADSPPLQALLAVARRILPDDVQGSE
jgi:hypothetical protein